MLRRAVVTMALIMVGTTALAQAGPPFLTNDPGTPGSAHWEINLGSMQTLTRAGASYQVPAFHMALYSSFPRTDSRSPDLECRTSVAMMGFRRRAAKVAKSRSKSR